MSPALVGVSGAKRNACAAICVDGQIRAACEQERVTRVRGVGLAAGPPIEAVEEVVRRARCRPDDVMSYVVAEPHVQLPAVPSTITLDHHQGHAATAFLTSPFDRAVVLVCDSQPGRELSVWVGDGGRLDEQRWSWSGRAFATLYSDCADLFDATGHGRAHGLEVLAHLGRGSTAEQLASVFRYSDGTLQVETGWQAHIHQLIQDEQRRRGHAAETASAVQRRIGELLLELLADIRAAVDLDSLCLAGGLFYNTYLNTLVRASGIFEQTFVPINPGNAGLAAGAALLVASRNGGLPRPTPVSPFLGPEYDSEAIKAALDGCKLSYEFVTESAAQDAAVDALRRGQLVAWFQGRMEWGHRALGNRSILADPQSPYVLDNLNHFLRKRDRSGPFGLAVCEDALTDLVCGPSTSPFMEYEYRPRDERLRHVMPAGATSLRVQTVGAEMAAFSALLKKMQQATGIAALVNTSFNGFHEPIVCSPRDAVRVFYGTGIDILVIGRFILRK